MKKLNEKQKKTLNIVITSLQIAIVLLAVILSAIVLANPNIKSQEVGKARTKLLPVLTNSMAGDKKDSFEEGDLVVAVKPKNPDELKVGDIITFKMEIGGNKELNTHRIISKDVTNGRVWFNTHGDANPEDKVELVYADEVLAVYKYHIKNVGSAIRWLQLPTNFLLVIVLPLIALFIYNIILFVRMMMQAKLNKLQEEKAAIAVDEDEIKRKAIEDYLASKSQAEKIEETPILEKAVESEAQAEVEEEKEIPKAAEKQAEPKVEKVAPKAEPKKTTAAKKATTKTATTKTATTSKATAKAPSAKPKASTDKQA